jgi:hypothetical protein
VNTGGGGGGGNATAADGGSGIVIIKIPDTVKAVFSSGVTATLSTAVAGFNIYTVTAAGASDVVVFA